MASTVAAGRLEPPSVAGFAACEACGSSNLQTVVDREDVNLLCRGCGRCWHIELGFVTRVNPRTCVDCPERAPCLRRWDRQSLEGGDVIHLV
jgi:hypothetical protein